MCPMMNHLCTKKENCAVIVLLQICKRWKPRCLASERAQSLWTCKPSKFQKNHDTSLFEDTLYINVVANLSCQSWKLYCHPLFFQKFWHFTVLNQLSGHNLKSEPNMDGCLTSLTINFVSLPVFLGPKHVKLTVYLRWVAYGIRQHTLHAQD